MASLAQSAFRRWKQDWDHRCWADDIDRLARWRQIAQKYPDNLSIRDAANKRYQEMVVRYGAAAMKGL